MPVRDSSETAGKSAAGVTRRSKFWASKFRIPRTSNLERSPVLRDYPGLVRCEEAVDECVFGELGRRVKIELHHDLRFMKFDGLR